MGSLVRVFCFAESLQKFCGKLVETCHKKLNCVRRGSGNSAGKVAEILRKFFCNGPFPNDPTSELLI